MCTVTTFSERPLPAMIPQVSNKIESPTPITGALLSKKYFWQFSEVFQLFLKEQK